MARRNARPLTLRPKGLSDAIDGSNAFKGAMKQLVNLVPATSTAQIFVPRSASIEKTDFPGFTMPTGITAILIIGTRVYGMISTGLYGAKDQPFCYDVPTDTFVTITGQSAANLPATQPTTGDWQPPHMEMIGNRIIVTHPGFAGGVGGKYFGWIDQTGFSILTLQGNTVLGSNVIRSITGDGGSTPILDGVQPGQQINGPGVPLGTHIVSVTNGAVDISTTGDTHSTDTIDNIPASAVALMEVGMYADGSGVVSGSYILNILSGTSIQLNQPTTSTLGTTPLQVTGGGTITLSANATATADLVALSIDGGSFAIPVWDSGNTNVNPLVAVPKWVSQFNGRAWYAVGNAEAFSDSLLPLNVSNATQVLTLGDTTPFICSAGLPLNNIQTGGIIQSLIAVKAGVMWQITGDQATNNLATNELNVAVGSQAPNTFTPCPLGLSFVAPDGLRILDFGARVSDPLGANGNGVSVPFINALTPTRMVSAFNQNVLRLSCQNALNPNQPVQEFWLDFNQKIWTGPHTFPAQQIAGYHVATGADTGHGFISAGYGIDAKLWLSGVNPTPSDTYIENGVQLSTAYETVLQPDNELMAENRMGQAAVAMSLPGGQAVGISCINEVGTVLNQVVISASSTPPTTWGSFVWGAAPWGGVTGYFRQYDIPWTAPIIFKQASILIVATSAQGYAVGNLYLKYQPLGYLLTVLGAA